MIRMIGDARRLLAVLAVLLLVFGACSGDGDESVAVPDDETPSTIPPARTLLRVGVEEWPDCLNPITCDSRALREQVLQHVLPVAFEIGADNEYVASPLLAGEPTVESVGSGAVVTYRIDPEARWDDGTPVTSSDFRATWGVIMGTPGADVAGYDQITAIDDADPLVAAVSLTTDYGEWRELFGGSRGWLLQADAVAGTPDLTGRFEDALPFGASSYRLGAWDGEVAVLTANTDYWAEDERPMIDQVRIIRVVIDDLVDPEGFDVLVPADGSAEPLAGFDVRSVDTTEILGVWFDRRTPLLQAAGNRQVLATLVDRGELIDLAGDVVAADVAVDCLGWVPGVGPWCDAAEVELPAMAPEAAAFTLFLEGWVADESGILVRDGAPFAVPVSFDSSVEGSADVAAEVVRSFQSIGIAATLTELPVAAWAADRSGAEPTGVGVYRFDMGPTPQVDALYGCRRGPDSSVLGWCDPAVVAASQALSATTDVDQQTELVTSIGTTAGADVAWLALAPVVRSFHLRTGVVTAPEDPAAASGVLVGLERFSVDR